MTGNAGNTGNTVVNDGFRPRIARFTNRPDCPHCPIARFPRLGKVVGTRQGR